MSILFRFSLLLLLALGSTAWAQADQQMKKGQQALRANQYSQALALFDAVIKADDRYPQVYVYRGLAHYALEDWFSAETDFQRALDRGELNRKDAAKVHNNRGMALYFLKDYDKAAVEFREAYVLDPNLKLARSNYDLAMQAKANPAAALRPGQEAASRPQASAYEGIYRDDRPQVKDPAREEATLKEVRDQRVQRLVVQDLAAGRYKPFKSRRIWGSAKTYKQPAFAAASQPYLTVVSVEVGRNETFVTLRVENPTLRDVSFCIAPPGRQASFYLTDRSGKLSGRMALREVVDVSISTCPARTRLASGEKMRFTLRFDPIPNDIGYVSLIEGNRTDGNQWNIYDIDLTE